MKNQARPANGGFWRSLRMRRIVSTAFLFALTDWRASSAASSAWSAASRASSAAAWRDSLIASTTAARASSTASRTAWLSAPGGSLISTPLSLTLADESCRRCGRGCRGCRRSGGGRCCCSTAFAREAAFPGRMCGVMPHAVLVDRDGHLLVVASRDLSICTSGLVLSAAEAGAAGAPGRAAHRRRHRRGDRHFLAAAAQPDSVRCRSGPATRPAAGSTAG